MDYVLDFARALAGGRSSRGRPARGWRGGAGGLAQLRIAVLGIMLGLALPSLRGTDWSRLLPGGMRVELPHGGRVMWPAGEVGLADVVKALPIPGWLWPRGATPAGDVVTARFGRCGRGLPGDCVVDGDTFRLRGEKVRIADIDTPETHPPRCAREARLGARATEELRDLLNAGPVTLEPYKRPFDRYGRRLAVVTRDGVSIGERLVARGLARRYDGGHRAGWCGWS